ncbi:ABC transporter permease [Mucilaginibacter sp.]|uniref:ABC transporter permease n=1 Tax=Mucilaginibacter sp. TaxID=1882438 RepID=UPI002611B9D2|nr:ABC transporter permease [Mucilaginibacter sp.]MDB5029503.1 FtsX-like permease family protein [Mucilaginibacter sp.]
MDTYTFHINTYDLAFFGTIFIGLTFILLLWFTKKINRAANRLLALAMVTIVLWIARILGINIGLSTYITNWSRLPLQFSLALGPLIFFYVLKITRPEYKFGLKDLLHFSPLVLELGAQALEVRDSINTGAATYQTPAFQQLNPVLQLLAFVSVTIYLCLAHRQIGSFYRRLKFNGGDRYRYELRWLHNLLVGFGLLWLLWIPFTAAYYLYYHHQLGVYAYCPLYLLLIVTIIWMAAAAHLRAESGVRAESPSFLKPPLPAAMKEKATWLKKAVQANHYYQDPELSLSLLAEKLELSPHELSRIINTVLKKSFNDFINEYRVAEVIRKMQDPAYDNITLLGIAYDAGFNSRTTFHRIFKQITGKSPAEYKNDRKKEIPYYNLEHQLRFASVISNQEITPKWFRQKLNRNMMFKNYFKIAFRGFWRHKLFTLINVTGLSIGISAFLVIYLIVHYDFTFDKFHKDSDRIYRVVLNMTIQGQKNYSSGLPGPMAEAIKNQATGIEEITPLYELSPHFVYIDKDKNVQKRFKNLDRIILADQQYFKIFNYVWLAGSSQHALDAPNQVVLTSRQAKLYFPSLSYHDMIGKVVAYDTLKTTVTGVVETFTKNSDFTFHDFISFSTATANKRFADVSHIEKWDRIFSGSEVLLKLAPDVSAAGVTKQIDAIYRKDSPPPLQGRGLSNTADLALQQLDDIHFNPNYTIFDFSSPANKHSLYGLLTIACFLLLLACINYVNLITAQAAQRAKEIGIRKTLGSSRIQLVVQFLSETFLLTLFAVIISALLAPAILKVFADVVSPDIHANILQQPDVMLFLLILTIVVSMLSGFYPAILLSGYKPVSVLKNHVQGNSNKTRNAWLRKSLTVSQFVVAQFFIMATILVSRQIYYVLHKDLGFKKDAILVINTPWQTSKPSSNQVLLNDFRSMPQVNLVSLGNDPPSADIYNRTRGTYIDGKKQIVTPEVVVKSGDENYLKIYQIKLLSGRKILESDTGKAVIINNTYAKILGFTNPHDAIGKQLNWRGGRGRNVSIVGVAADFNQRSLHSAIYPSVIMSGGGDGRPMMTLHVSLKPETAGGNEWKTAITNMGKAWKRVYPDDDFDCHFYDDTIARFYDEEQHTSTLLTWATGFSILISCLGLLGLAIYTTNQRTKEIGIRKVFGASVAQIVTLLSTELISLILLAFIIVTPIAWYAVNKWMESFADHVAISWWVFVISGAGMLLTGLFTLSFRTIRAGMANPVKSLRNE